MAQLKQSTATPCYALKMVARQAGTGRRSNTITKLPFHRIQHHTASQSTPLVHSINHCYATKRGHPSNQRMNASIQGHSMTFLLSLIMCKQNNTIFLNISTLTLISVFSSKYLPLYKNNFLLRPSSHFCWFIVPIHLK